MEFTVILRTLLLRKKKKRDTLCTGQSVKRIVYLMKNTPCYQCSLRLALASNPKYASLLFFVFLQRLEQASNIRHRKIAFDLN